MGRIAGVTAEETKQRLVRAAADVFAQRGYEGTTVADISREAGLSSGAIYAHYSSKAELLARAIHLHGAHEITSLLTDGGPSGVLDLLVAKGASLGRRNRTQGSLLVEAIVAARRDPEVAAALGREVGGREHLFADLLRLAQDQGEISSEVGADVVARFCLMLALGSLLVRTLDLPKTNADDWSSLISRLVDGFRPKEDR